MDAASRQPRLIGTAFNGESATWRDDPHCCPDMEIAGSLLWFSSVDPTRHFPVVGNEGEIYGYDNFLFEYSFLLRFFQGLLVEF